MWDALADVANAEGKTLFELINEIHRDALRYVSLSWSTIGRRWGISDPSHFR
jgi:hypothetical protein